MKKYQMNYLYHLVPDDLEGTILYPLNILKEKNPELYAKKVKKYIGRENIMRQRIPKLDCLWNDVLHFTAVPFQEVRKALEQAGKTNMPSRSFFQIDPYLLERDKTIVYLYAHKTGDKKLKIDNFASYNPEGIQKYATLPQETKDYYKEALQKGDEILLFHRVPHILYKGSLDVANLPISTSE